MAETIKELHLGRLADEAAGLRPLPPPAPPSEPLARKPFPLRALRFGPGQAPLLMGAGEE